MTNAMSTLVLFTWRISAVKPIFSFRARPPLPQGAGSVAARVMEEAHIAPGSIAIEAVRGAPAPAAAGSRSRAGTMHRTGRTVANNVPVGTAAPLSSSISNQQLGSVLPFRKKSNKWGPPIGNARIKKVYNYQSCMVSNLPIIRSGGRWDGLSKAELYTILMEKRQEKVNVLGVSTGEQRAALMGPGSAVSVRCVWN